jgi:hypothetical protein
MTETECMDCDYSENCDWGLIMENNVPMTPPCEMKAWHDYSLKAFAEGIEQVRARIITAGE